MPLSWGWTSKCSGASLTTRPKTAVEMKIADTRALRLGNIAVVCRKLDSRLFYIETANREFGHAWSIRPGLMNVA